METYLDYCKNFIIDNIENLEGQQVYACDLGFELTSAINSDGSATFSTDEAREYLKEWWDETADYWEYEEENFGEHRWNPFSDPEAYHCCMIIEGVRNLIGQVPIIEKKWDECIKITPALIKKVIKAIEDPSLEISF